MYRAFNNNDRFTPHSMIHEHNLRDSNHNFFVPRTLTESLKKSFTYIRVTVWNDIYPSQPRPRPFIFIIFFNIQRSFTRKDWDWVIWGRGGGCASEKIEGPVDFPTTRPKLP
jgi:hypothetical protein